MQGSSKDSVHIPQEGTFPNACREDSRSRKSVLQTKIFCVVAATCAGVVSHNIPTPGPQVCLSCLTTLSTTKSHVLIKVSQSVTIPYSGNVFKRWLHFTQPNFLPTGVHQSRHLGLKGPWSHLVYCGIHNILSYQYIFRATSEGCYYTLLNFWRTLEGRTTV